MVGGSLSDNGIDCEVIISCLFAEAKAYLCHIIRPKRMKTAGARTQIIEEPQDSTTQSEVDTFSWQCYKLRQSMPHLSRIAARLNMKLLNDQPNTSHYSTTEERMFVADLK